MILTKEQAIQQASYFLGEGVREEFNKKDSTEEYSFHVTNSEGKSLRVDKLHKGKYNIILEDM